jgi:hypothetical protein
VLQQEQDQLPVPVEAHPLRDPGQEAVRAQCAEELINA